MKRECLEVHKLTLLTTHPITFSDLLMMVTGIHKPQVVLTVNDVQCAAKVWQRDLSGYCNPSAQETEIKGLEVDGQPGLHRKTLSKQINDSFQPVTKEPHMVKNSYECDLAQSQ